jgi:single-strand DNA-binding protein
MANLNLNKVILGGRLTSDVELKQTPQGIAVCSFSVAVNRKGKDAQTDFINCQAWRNAAEIISKHFKKGSSICLVGSIQTRTWNDNNGQKRYATEVIVDEVYFVDSKADTGTDTSPTVAPTPNFEEVFNDDDLPF